MLNKDNWAKARDSRGGTGSPGKRVVPLFLALLMVMSTVVLAPQQADAAATCFGRVATIVSNESFVPGTEGNDVIVGGPAAQTIHGGSGYDLICGRGGDDTIHGHTGGDKIEGGQGNDSINGGKGNDEIYGNYGDDKLYGKEGDDFIDGGAGKDRISGLDGDDTIRGGPDDDSIWGYGGNDNIDAGIGNDWVNGHGGNDTIRGNQGNDRLYGGEGNDIINGNNGDDFVFGNDGDDQLNGDADTDRLYGHEGHDTLRGGSGNDTMYGYAGNDQLYGDAGTDYARGDEGTDTCTAETLVTCEVADVPVWVDGYDAGLTWDSVSSREFTISWGAVSGSTHLEIIVTNEAGEYDPSGTAYGSSGSYTVDRFNGFALDPTEEYHVEVVPVNAVGRGKSLGLSPISLVAWNIEVQHNGIAQASAMARLSSLPGISTWAGYGTRQCSTITSIALPEVLRGSDFDIDIRFDAWTEFCRDGDKFTTNLLTHDCDDNSNKTKILDAAASSPPGEFPNAKNLVNTFECSTSGDGVFTGTLTSTIRGTAAVGGVSVTGEVEASRTTRQETHLDANITIRHQLVGTPRGYCWKATHTDSRADHTHVVPSECIGLIA